jgi:hypothetical protein
LPRRIRCSRGGKSRGSRWLTVYVSPFIRLRYRGTIRPTAERSAGAVGRPCGRVGPEDGNLDPWDDSRLGAWRLLQVWTRQRR